MKDFDYTFAVARIRSNENKLLTSRELNSVIAAKDYDEAVKRLNDCGYEIEGDDYGEALRKKTDECTELIFSVLPDKSQFDSILIKNDFQNLKVLTKAFVCEKDPSGLMTTPSKYPPEELKELVFANDNGHMPEELAHAHRSAYRILTKTQFAQLSDSVIDRAALEWSVKLAAKADNPVMAELADTVACVTGIKALYRCILSGKAESFMVRCVTGCTAYSKEDIIAAASKGMDEFRLFLSRTSAADVAAKLDESAVAFEKACDDAVMKVIRKDKDNPFGIAALVGYYYAVRTEVLNVRIILSAKKNGMPEENIRERMRVLYV